MYCKNCGQPVDENAVACPSCGVRPRGANKFCHNCGNQMEQNQVMCLKCGVAMQPAAAAGAKNKMVAVLLGILLGALGIHKFYLGYNMEGIIMLLVSLGGGVVTCGIGSGVVAIIGLIEGILYLTKTDEDFERTYVQNKRGWF